MNSDADCFVCKKHQDIKSFIGEIIAERGGLLLTHFPDVESEKATKGHLIIETKRHIRDLFELNDEEAFALGGMIRSAVQAIRVLGAEHVYMFRINDKVAHLHIHLVPRYPGTPKEYWGTKILEWPDRETIKLPQIQQVAQKLKQSLIV